MKSWKRVALALSLLSYLVACSGGEDTDSGKTSGDQIVAVVAGEPITLAEIEDRAASDLRKLEQDRYEILRNALDNIAILKMIEQEAADRGITTAELTKAEIVDKAIDPTPQEVASFYEANKHRAGGRTLEEVGQLIYENLRNQRRHEAMTTFHETLRAKYPFEIQLEPPRFEVVPLADAPTRGLDDAPITLIEFGNFQCQFCRRAHSLVTQLLSEYGDQVRYVFQDFPLANFPRAVQASEAARCAGEQGRYWDYFEDLMSKDGDLEDADLLTRAERLAIDMEAFRSCYTTRRFTPAIQASFESGRQIGVTATPTFFVNGIMIRGAAQYSEFKAAVERELGRSSRES